MAQADFTKEEADFVLECLMEIGKALSRPKKLEFFGHFNDIALFIESAKLHAPSEKTDEIARDTSDARDSGE